MKIKILLISAIAVIAVIFLPRNTRAAEGDVWITPTDQNVGTSQTFDIEVHMDTGGENVGAFNMFFDFTAADVTIDTAQGDTGLDKGADTSSYTVMLNADDISNGHFRFAGIATSGYANGSDVHIATIHAQATSGFTSGTSSLSLRVNDLSNDLGASLASGTLTGAIITYADSTPPVRSSGSPSGTLASGTTSTTLSLTTDENATCKYGTISGTAYNSIANTFTTTGTTSHSEILSGLSDGTSYVYYIRCEDSLRNQNTSDYTISFDINTPPTDITLSSNTIDENQSINTVVGTLSTTDADVGDSHTYSLACSVPGSDDSSFNISGTSLRSSESFDYESQSSYGICIKTDDGNSGTYDKNFNITINDLDDVAPIIAEVTPVTDPTADSTPNYTFSSDEAGTISYGGSCSSATTSASSGNNTVTFNTLSDGTYSNCTVTVTDAATNASNVLNVTAFTIDATPPVRSSGLPSGTLASGTTSTTLSLTTDENATCKYGTISGTAYNSIANTFTTTGTTSHSESLSGLSDGTSYVYYIRCENSLSNQNTSDYTISFDVSNGATPTCSAFTYSSWGTCQVSNNQTRTVVSSSPSGCTGGSPIVSRSCTYDEGVDEEDDSEIEALAETITSPYAKITDFLKEKLKTKKTLYSKKGDFLIKGKDAFLAGGKVKLYKGSKKEDEDKIEDDGEWKLKIDKKKSKTYTYTIKYYDADGNKVDSKKYKIKIDIEDPEFTNIPDKLYKGKGDIIWWNAKDNKGIKKFKVYFNGKIEKIKLSPKSGKDEEVRTEFIVPAETPAGLHSMKIKAYDKAGNKTTKEVEVFVR